MGTKHWRQLNLLSPSSLGMLLKQCLLLRSICILATITHCTAATAFPNNVDTIMTMNWDHAVDLNEDFRLLWTHLEQDITFEIQARALGYVGLGFSPNGEIAGTDIAIGWVDRGHTFFQDRYVSSDGMPEPLVDPSQDYILIMGYENSTHTVIRFRRKLQTCDVQHDVAITNSTMRIMFMYSDEDPKDGSVGPDSLPNPFDAWQTARSLLLTQKTNVNPQRSERTRKLELRNEQVELPYADDSLIWCKVFTLDKLPRKHHIIKYEPIFDSSWSIHYLQYITLYECQNEDKIIEEMASETGRVCSGLRSISETCNAIVATWTRGSEGFSFPKEAGYPLHPKQAKFYLMETQYFNPNGDHNELQFKKMLDNSGLRIHFTDRLRQHDAGVLSIGMDPNWRHIIPPGQKRVVSEGQCMEACTAYAFPRQGINIFAVMMRTHQIGREIKLRQIRGSEEFPPIAHDSNVDPMYQDFRRLSQSVNSLPGDRLIAECIYDSSSRNAITLGGHKMKEESCTVFTLYYPRQKALTTCHSLPSLSTVLRSLGIEQLATNSNPIVIASPAELSGMTLETRLMSYDWQNQFESFQQETLQGFFKPICRGARNNIVPISEYMIGHNVKLSKGYKEQPYCKQKRLVFADNSVQLELPVLHLMESNEIFQGSARNSRSSFIETLALSAASTRASMIVIPVMITAQLLLNCFI